MQEKVAQESKNHTWQPLRASNNWRPFIWWAVQPFAKISKLHLATLDAFAADAIMENDLRLEHDLAMFYVE